MANANSTTRQQDNEYVWWQLNVALVNNVEEAYFTSLGAEDLSVVMVEKAIKAAKRICPRNADTEDFYFDMCLYYLNATTYFRLIGGEEQQTPARAKAAENMMAFEEKFNRIIRKAVRAA